MITKYHLIHFDGPHTLSQVYQEVLFFHKRAVSGTIFVFDDTYVFTTLEDLEQALTSRNDCSLKKTDFSYDHETGMYFEFYNHQQIDRWLLSNGYTRFYNNKTEDEFYKCSKKAYIKN